MLKLILGVQLVMIHLIVITGNISSTSRTQISVDQLHVSIVCV